MVHFSFHAVGEDAINCLLDSPWATGKDAIFTDRLSVVRFCHELLLKELFHRATLVKRKPKSTAVTDGNDTPGESGAEVRGYYRVDAYNWSVQST